MPASDLARQLRGRSLCGGCAASSLMVWQNKSDQHVKLSADSLPPGAERVRDPECWYLVKCSFYRFTVHSPENLTHCDAYKEIGGD